MITFWSFIILQTAIYLLIAGFTILILTGLEKAREAKKRQQLECEIAKEIFEDIDDLIESATIVDRVSVDDFRAVVSEIKKKYTEDIPNKKV